MRIEPIGSRTLLGPEQCLTGVSAALAEARKVWREHAPQTSWAEVTAQANQLRAREPMTLIQALHVVFGQLAVGR